MTRHETHTGGLLERLRGIGESLLALARNRVELFASELQEEKLRLINLLVWFSLAIVLGAGGLLVAIGTLAVWLWDVARYAGLIGLALAAFVGGAGILWGLRRRIETGSMPFTGTLAEFRKDTECLLNYN
jgi:uncharacterized membrane protein YqjE